MSILTVDPKEISPTELQRYLNGAVAPRPIAFASTVDADGNVNLSPFSFFNIFSINPPVLIFSPSRRVRDNTTKHTLENILEVKEVVINVVNYSMVQQASLASTEYAKGVNEFVRAGFTEIPSERVRPPRVKESPVSFECKVNEVIPLGSGGGAGNLVICEVLLFHLREDILNNDRHIDPQKLDVVARMGDDWYCRAQGDAIFHVPKPLRHIGIGIDNVPHHILQSDVLTGNDLAMLATIEVLPTAKEIYDFKKTETTTKEPSLTTHDCAKALLKQGEVKRAWLVLLSC